MNNIPQLLAEFQAKGITLFLFENTLKFKAAPGVLGDNERAELKARKAELVAFFQAQRAAQFPPLTAAETPQVPSHIQTAWWNWVRHAPSQLPHERLPLIKKIVDCSPDRIEAVLQDIITRHRTLASYFVERAGRLTPDYHAPKSFHVETESLAEEQAMAQALEFVGRPLPIESAWLLKAKAIALPDGAILLALVVHHILADGYSIELLDAELNQAFSTSEAPLNAEDDIQFTDYVAAERAWFDGPSGQALIAYWKSWVEGQKPLQLAGKALEWEARGVNANNGFMLPPPIVRRMEFIAQQLNSSAFIVYLTIFALSLAQWSGQKEFAIRCVGNLRGTHAPFPVIGNLVCIDPIGVQISDACAFSALVRMIARDYYSALTLRLPSLLNFPAHAAWPGIEKEKFSNRIAATINYSPGKAYESATLESHDDGGTIAGIDWPPSVERAVPQDWPAELWPINFRLSAEGQQISGLFQFNQAIIARAEQDSLMAIFFATLMTVMTQN